MRPSIQRLRAPRRSMSRGPAGTPPVRIPGLALCGLLLLASEPAGQLSDLQPGINFPTATSAFGSGRSENIDVGDADNDGDLDVIVANGGDGSAQANALYVNNGGLQGATVGTFSNGTATRLAGVPNDTSRDCEFADFDADGDLDIYIANRGTTANGGEVSRAYTNLGGLQFGSAGFYTETSDGFWGTLISVPAGDEVGAQDGQGPWRDYSCDCDFGDLDDDGDIDLFHSSYGPNINGSRDSRIFMNDGEGVFNEHWPWIDGGADIRLHTLDIDLVDLDGDWDLDIYASSRDSQPRVYRSNLYGGTGSGNLYSDITQFALLNQGIVLTDTNNYEAEFADLDGDGDFDVWSINQNGFTDRILRNNGNLTFTQMNSWIQGDPSVDESEIDFLDYDGDGDLDAFSANFSGTNWIYQSGVAQGLTGAQGLFHRNGTSSGGSQATWQETPNSSNGGTTLDGEVADIDNDGDHDLLLANDSNQNNRLWRNQLGVPDTHAPTFHLLTQQGDTVNGVDTVIHAQVRDNSSHYLVAYYDARLVFEVDDCGEIALPMTYQGSMQFRGVIPGQIDRSVRYRVEVTDLAGNTAVSGDMVFLQGVPAGAPCPCDDSEAAVLDANGDVVFPVGTDMSTVEYFDVDEDMGYLDELFPDEDHTTDLWDPNDPCVSIGGELPDEASTGGLQQDLIDAGIVGATPEEIVASLEMWEQDIANKESQSATTWPTTSSAILSSPYLPPPLPNAPDPEECYIMGGADLVFVHGMIPEHLIDKINGVPEAATEWVTPTQWPASIENPEFYDPGGYYKSYARGFWASHISRYLTQRNIKNRYLIVSFNNSERLEVAAQSVLAQIGDAMRTGLGVVDPLDPLGTPPLDFGTPSYVVISQSTGGPVTDVAMAAATQFPNLGVDYIPGHCKAHIGLHSATSGSRIATAVIVLSGYITTNVPPWLCPLARFVINKLSTVNISCPLDWSLFTDSMFLDLVPTVMQLRWGSLIDSTPIPTVTVAGGHPSYVAPLKHIWLDGFDDGVTSVNSQLGNPNPALAWPSGFYPKWPGLIAFIQGFDMGVAQVSTRRAVGFFLDQFVEPLLSTFTPPLLSAGGAVPHLSPSGMVQRVANRFANTPYDTLARYGNHYSFLLSASDHNTDIWVSDHPDYLPTSGKPNYEETRVITDGAIYTPYQTAMPYPGDDAPLLLAGTQPRVKLVRRGRKVTFKVFGFKKTWWIWRRQYHLIDGYQSQHELDYAYRHLLRDPNQSLDCGPPAWEDVGCSLGGDYGPPILFGDGDLTAGSDTTMDLGSAAPNSAAALFLSFGSSTPVAFKCGVLKAVGSSQIFLPGLTTDGAGEIRTSFPWPAGVPSGTKIWAQYVVQDSSAPCGFAISNALCITVP